MSKTFEEFWNSNPKWVKKYSPLDPIYVAAEIAWRDGHKEVSDLKQQLAEVRDKALAECLAIFGLPKWVKDEIKRKYLV